MVASLGLDFFCHPYLGGIGCPGNVTFGAGLHWWGQTQVTTGAGTPAVMVIVSCGRLEHGNGPTPTPQCGMFPTSMAYGGGVSQPSPLFPSPSPSPSPSGSARPRAAACPCPSPCPSGPAAASPSRTVVHPPSAQTAPGLGPPPPRGRGHRHPSPAPPPRVGPQVHPEAPHTTSNTKPAADVREIRRGGSSA